MDVLVVEDEPLVRETAVAVLREAGFRVAEAALALAERAHGAARRRAPPGAGPAAGLAAAVSDPP